MTVETIVNHIEKLIEMGPEAGGVTLGEIAYLKKEISPIHFLKIEKALEEVSEKAANDEPPLLTPIKRIVGANISFRDIQLARVLLGYVRRKV
jgi:hypothetical protein